MPFKRLAVSKGEILTDDCVSKGAGSVCDEDERPTRRTLNASNEWRNCHQLSDRRIDRDGDVSPDRIISHLVHEGWNLASCSCKASVQTHPRPTHGRVFDVPSILSELSLPSQL